MTRLANARKVHLRNQIGAATAEYAAVTAAGCGIAGVLIKMLSGDFGKALLDLIFKLVKGFIGV
ncbi:MAG: DUF4244 domain-containing protein [Nocardioidaceae bacterium]|nr:MAG: DUF4244 domain-containing protein [Nocardioidaceae bacterium]